MSCITVSTTAGMTTTKYINVDNEDLDLGALVMDGAGGGDAGGDWVIQFIGSGTWTFHDDVGCEDSDPTLMPTSPTSLPSSLPSAIPSLSPSTLRWPTSAPSAMPAPQPSNYTLPSLSPAPTAPSMPPSMNSAFGGNASKDCIVRWLGEDNETTFAVSLALLTKIPLTHDTLTGAYVPCASSCAYFIGLPGSPMLFAYRVVGHCVCVCACRASQ